MWRGDLISEEVTLVNPPMQWSRFPSSFGDSQYSILKQRTTSTASVECAHPHFASLYPVCSSFTFCSGPINAFAHILLVCLQLHRMYAIRYWCCELLCLVNIVAQMYAMNRFFDGEFYDYGLRVLQVSDQLQEKRVDPMIYIFPRVTKCSFHKFGPSGTVQNHDALCVLPLNVVNEKTYILIWFWFVALAALLCVLVAYRACLIGCPSLRPRLLRISRKITSRRDARVVAQHLDVGDWWVLYMLGKNLDPAVYNEIVVDLAKRMEDPKGAMLRR